MDVTSSLLTEHLEHLVRVQGGMKNFGVPVVFIPIPVGAFCAIKTADAIDCTRPKWGPSMGGPSSSIPELDLATTLRGQLVLMRGSESDAVREFIGRVSVAVLAKEPVLIP